MFLKKGQPANPQGKEREEQEANGSPEMIEGEELLIEKASPNLASAPAGPQATSEDSGGTTRGNLVKPNAKAAPVASMDSAKGNLVESVPGLADMASAEIDDIVADDENIEILAETAFEKPREGEKEEDLADEQDLNLFVAGEDGNSEEHEDSGDSDDTFSGFFADEEDEANPLAGLISSLPDIKAADLLQEAQNVQQMLQQVRRGER